MRAAPKNLFLAFIFLHQLSFGRSSSYSSCLPCSCGKKGNFGRIQGGEDADPGEYRWQAGLRNDKLDYFCSGTLIDPKWVLTAAHCIVARDPESFEVILGSFLSNETDEYEVSFNVSRVIIHSNYEVTTFDNDIALIELEGAAPSSNPFIEPICLPFGRREPVCFDSVTATGWGRLFFGGPRSNPLQEVTVQYYSTNTCRSNLFNYNDIITGNMVCAGNVNQSGCLYDEGGPMIEEEGSINFLHGISSRVFDCGNEDVPTIYTKVENYLSWIEYNTFVDFCKVYSYNFIS